ncbi:hypothetical protein M433DRAFT_9233 [Acidomyces richmondensis BFW]|nr:hypothetical protein M433DRAFT_9233 [Acidomyces richmondensis BFW]
MLYSGSGLQMLNRFYKLTQEVLEIATQAELEAAKKKPKKKATQQANATSIENVQEEAIETVSSDSDDDCIFVAATRSS